MNTNEKQAFEVMQVEQISENTWRIRGRNYKDIRIRDTLYAYMDGEANALPFEIVGIIAFGKNLSELSYGYASELTVRGDEGEKLNSISHLYTG